MTKPIDEAEPLSDFLLRREARAAGFAEAIERIASMWRFRRWAHEIRALSPGDVVVVSRNELQAIADDLRRAGCIPVDGETSAALHRHIDAALAALEGVLKQS